jgi:hypothetical protein
MTELCNSPLHKCKVIAKQNQTITRLLVAFATECRKKAELGSKDHQIASMSLTQFGWFSKACNGCRNESKLGGGFSL